MGNVGRLCHATSSQVRIVLVALLKTGLSRIARRLVPARSGLHCDAERAADEPPRYITMRRTSPPVVVLGHRSESTRSVPRHPAGSRRDRPGMADLGRSRRL